MKIKLLLAKSLAFLSLLLLFFIPSRVNAQNLSVSGKITNENGTGIPGVTIQVSGPKKNSTTTATDGTFRLSGLTGKETLLISSVGYAPQEVYINNRSTIDVSLTVAEKVLDEVVMIGYGSAKKSDVTGAVTKISAETIRERPAQNVLQAIQGKAAGVHVSTNLKPGELPVVRIRGYRSINYSNEPLYVVDGIPLVNGLGVNSFTMSDLNPNDIASIEILKDASATAIYGSRGANGVVLITTVKGKKGKVSLNFNSTVSFDSYHSMTDWMNGGEYVDRWRLALINGRLYQSTTNTNLNQPATMWYADPFLDRDKMAGLTADQTALASVWAGYEWDVFGVTPRMRPTTAAEQALGWPAQVPIYNSANVRSYDWLADASQQGMTQNHTIGLTSGSEMSKLSMSLSYYRQKGVQRDQDYNRYSANVGGEITPTKWFTLGISTIASLSNQSFGIQAPNTSNTGSKDLYSRATDQFPYALPKDANGNWIRNPGGNLSLWNPIIDIDQAKNDRRSGAVLASIFSEIKFTPWLKYRVNFGVQYRQFRSGTWAGPEATSHLKTPNTAAYATQENFSWVVENLLYLDKSFGTAHKFGLTLLQSSQKSRRENSSISVAGVINPLSLWYDLASNTQGNPGIGTGFTENTLSSFMARVNYTLLDKYLITASARYDGSSVLAPDHKWQLFKSAAIAWKMQQEKFLNSVNWISELKLRLGYGGTGNSVVDPYTTSGPLSRNPYVFGNLAGIGYLPQLVQNPELKWEGTSQANIGLDFGFFKHRITGTIELYRQNTTDLIFTRSLPAVTGYVQKVMNIGQTRNTGIEVTLSGTVYQKRDFSWNVDLNWGRNKDEIVELVNGKQDMVADRLFIGQPSQVYYNYQNAGIWGGDAKDLAEMALFNANGTNFRPGNIRVVDQNNDKRIDANDFVILGTPRPKWSGGVTSTWRYKNWQLNAFLYLRWGQTYFGGYPNSYGGTFPNGRVENDVWSWTNTGGRWPMPNAATAQTNITAAMQYNNGSFGALRNVSLSYTVPKGIVGRIGMNDMVINFQVLNPWMFGPGVVKWGINPEDDTNWTIASTNTNPLGGTNNNTVLPRSFVFGIRAGF